MRVYISGPITLNRTGYKKAFYDAEAKLKALGYDVVNPGSDEEDAQLEASGIKDKWTTDAWKWFIKRDIDQVSECDGIYLMKGWEASPGCNIEYWVAKKFNLKIMYEEESNEELRRA